MAAAPAMLLKVEPVVLDDIEVELRPGEEASHDAVLQLCKAALPGWEAVQLSQLKFSIITGGISNQLVRVQPAAGSGLVPVAVKVFGAKTELMIDRDTERIVLVELNKSNHGAPVLAFFANGRIEQFLYCKTLTPQEMCNEGFIPFIAERLRQFHDSPVSLPKEATLFQVIRAWLETARTLPAFDSPEKQRRYDQVDFPAIDAELEAIEKLCTAVNSPVVFCHNDLLSGNILILQPGPDAPPTNDGPLMFIDFEYSAYSHRGFDLGNHFNEYAGFDCDYGRYPEAKQQALFLRNYLRAGSGTEVETEADLEQAVARLSAEANVFALASHIYWGVWALIQARYSPIDFDYLDYSGLRWAEYHRRKDEFVGQACEAFDLTPPPAAAGAAAAAESSSPRALGHHPPS